METNLISDAQLLDQTFPGGRPTQSGKHHGGRVGISAFDPFCVSESFFGLDGDIDVASEASAANQTTDLDCLNEVNFSDLARVILM